MMSLRFDLTAEWHATTHKTFAVSENEEFACPVGKNRDIHQFNDKFAAASFFVSTQDASARGVEKNAILTANGDRILIRDIARNDDTVTLIACLSSSKLSSYDTPAVQICGLDSEYISRIQAKLLLGFLNSRFADYLIRPFVDKHIKGYVLTRVPVPSISDDCAGCHRIIALVDKLLEIGQKSSNQVVWKSKNGKQLLRSLDEAVADYLDISSEDRLLVYGQFPHLYAE